MNYKIGSGAQGVPTRSAFDPVETVQQVLFEGGGDYVMSVKENQKELVQTLATLLTSGKFSPSAHGKDPGAEPGSESEPA